MKLSAYVSVLAVILFAAAGCGGLQGKQNVVTSRNGLPDARWLVGGGLDIDYAAPADGIIYVVDQSTGRYLVTETVQEADTFSFTIEQISDESLELTGINRTSKIVLYFVPETAISPACAEED